MYQRLVNYIKFYSISQIIQKGSVITVRVKMEDALRIIKGIALLLWSVLVSIVEPFIPKRYLHKDVKNQIVLITGAGSGFGRLLARKFAVNHGSIVVLWDINKNGTCIKAEYFSSCIATLT